MHCAVAALLALAQAIDGAQLHIEPELEDGRVAFRIWNPTPVAVPPTELRFSVLRRGQETVSLRSTLAAIPAFGGRPYAPPDWEQHAPGIARVCVRANESGRERCAEAMLPGTLPDLSVGEAALVDGAWVIEVRNEGDAASERFDLRVTTRGSGRVIGTTRLSLAPLAARSTRSESAPLELWGSGQPRLLRSISQACCTTEMEIDMGNQIQEEDESNNLRRLEHPLPPA